MDISCLIKKIVNRNRSEQGITLIELLMGMSLLIIVGSVVWSVFLQGLRFSNQAISKNNMLQEVNYTVARLVKIHQTADTYEIISEDCKITVLYTVSGYRQANEVFKHPQLCFQTNNNGAIDPNINDNSFRISIYSISEPDKKVELQKTLYRLKGEAEK